MRNSVVGILTVTAAALSITANMPSAVAQAGEQEASSPSVENADSLEGLYSQLKKERRPMIAARLSQRIWSKWRHSGSSTIDLLSGWARKSMREKKYNIALDLLDQITTLRPQHAEGWNQRATLHFIMKNYGKSLQDVERVLLIEPRHFGALAGLGHIFQALGDKKRALATWYRVLEIYPAMAGAQKAVIELEEAIAAKRI